MTILSRRAALGGSIAAVTFGSAAAQESSGLRLHGVVQKVNDFEQAVAFFGDSMGFGLAEFDPRRGWARLSSNVPLYLEATTGRTHPREAASSKISFQTSSLEASTEFLRRAQADFFEAPREVAVGRSVRFVDPSGAVHSILQPNYVGAPVGEPRIYNCGFHLPVAAIPPARNLIESGLGFAPLTERYYPPSVPYLEADRTFGFMVHHHQPSETDFVERQDARADDAGAWLVFGAPDLDRASRSAVAHGAVALGRPPSLAGARRRAFLTPGGAPFEIWSWS